MDKKRLPIVILFLLIIIGLSLRLKWWPEYINFGYERARDAELSTKIFAQKKLTLIGPVSEIEGIFHGPIYYYLIGSIYFIFGKNPAWVSLFQIIINIICIPIIFLVGKKLFSERVGLIAAFIFTISYEAISYGLWLANPSLALPFIILSYYFFYKAFNDNQKYLPVAAFLLAVSISFEIVIILNIISIVAYGLICNKKRITLKKLLLSFLSFTAPLINYPLFEIKHNFLMTNKVIQTISDSGNDLKTVFQYIIPFIDGMAKEFSNIFFPIHGFFAGVIMITLFVYLWKKIAKKNNKKSSYLLVFFWLLANFPIFLFSFSMTGSEYSFLGAGAAATLLFAAFVNESIEHKKNLLAFIFLLSAFIGNLVAWKNYLPDPEKRMFESQRGVFLKDTLSLIDYTYLQSNKQPFFVNTITVPLYISPLWDYLYSWHGQEKFGYLPSKDNASKLQFLIIENGWGETYQIFKQKETEKIDKISTIEETKKFGEIIVQKRKLIK